MLNDSKALGLLSWTSVGVISVRHTHSPLDQLQLYYSKETKTPSSRATDNDSTIFCHIKKGVIAKEKVNVGTLHRKTRLNFLFGQSDLICIFTSESIVRWTIYILCESKTSRI